MPVKIRLMRIGAKKQPFYRVVAVDERKKRTGQYLELLGTYNPLTEPKEIKLDQAKIDAWIKKGAQPSDGFLRMIGKAPQRPPRKPKKESKQTTDNTVQQEPSAETESPQTQQSAPEADNIAAETQPTEISAETVTDQAPPEPSAEAETPQSAEEEKPESSS